MHKESITYTDFNGTTLTEDFFFNFSKAEVMEMEMGTAGGFAERLQKIINANNIPELIAVFKTFVLDAYGVKSEDGKRFMKKKPDGTRYADDFAETEAYSTLFMQLATDADAASKFVNEVFPADMVAEAQKNANHLALKN